CQNSPEPYPSRHRQHARTHQHSSLPTTRSKDDGQQTIPTAIAIISQAIADLSDTDITTPGPR
ncbi:MAG: hypothetical protein K2Z76_08355, partial [Mycobacterium gordonae]|nr:hypothetical protein [Mycobacterium gordonae]